MFNVMHPVSCVSVKEFFEIEKEQTRQLLIGSVNSLIDTVFSQLNDKFVQCFNVQEPVHHKTENQLDLNILADQQQQLETNSNSNSNSQVQLIPSASSTLNIKFKQESNWEVDEEEDCECDDCLNGDLIKHEENDEDDEDSLEWIEENLNRESQIPTKRQRTSNEVPNNRIHRTHSIPTSESQVISLQCFQANCPKVFANRKQLGDHLLLVHSITRYRCYVIDCQQKSFEDSAQLNDHLRTTHAHLTEWQCDQCSAPFKTFATLKNHCTLYHQFGLFRCLFPHCQFIADCRGRLHSHLLNHREQEYACGQCHYKSKDANKIVAHERAHAGIKPYYCKWPHCRYASAYKFNTQSHVRGHLKKSAIMRGQGEMEDDPKKYLGVIEELL